MNKSQLAARIEELRNERGALVQEDLTAQTAVRDCSYGQAGMRDVTECERTALNLKYWDEEYAEELAAHEADYKKRFGVLHEALNQRF